MVKRTVLREKGDQYCQLEIELRDGRLSICGSEGRILSIKEARREALEYWRSFFDESPEEMIAMGKRCGKRFTSALRAARYVIECDGELHGLDVQHRDGDRIFVVESCGQIRESLAQWFPEAIPFMGWHLNDMNAGCLHQTALGWGNGRTIALDRSTATPAQLESLDGAAYKAVEAKREKAYKAEVVKLQGSAHERIRFVRKYFAAPTVSQNESLASGYPAGIPNKERAELLGLLRTEVEKAIPFVPFDAAIYKDSIGCPCPQCGYQYGTEWLKRELPPEVVVWAESFGQDE